MSNRVFVSLVALAFVIPALSLAQDTNTALQQVEAACAASRGNGFVGLAISSIRRRDYWEADRVAEFALEGRVTKSERACLERVRAIVSEVHAEQARQAAERARNEPPREPLKAQERVELVSAVQIGTTSCILEPGSDGTANSAATSMLRAYQEGRFDEAKATAQSILDYNGQTVTRGQRDCAEKITADVQAKKVEEANKPSNQLKRVYLDYMAVQACYESRKEYRVPYVSPQELSNARAITRRDEASLLRKHPTLSKQKDTLWEVAKQDYGSTLLATMLRVVGTKHNDEAARLCRLAAMNYSADQGQQQQRIKKDF